MLSQVQTILCATDLGSKSDQVLRMTASVAQQYGARIVLLHTIEQVSEGVQNMLSGMLPGSEMEKLHHEAMESALNSLKEQWGALVAAESSDTGGFAGEEPELLVEHGEPAQTILEVADGIDADLLIIGTHSHSRLGEWLLGSVAYKVIHASRRPVLLVPLT
jgi:nucleotide-binding universal stress UspA family protein